MLHQGYRDFAKQKLFAESNKSNTQSCLNVVDKGYQCVLTVMVQGQYCLLPAFAESKKQFKATWYFILVLVQLFALGLSVLSTNARCLGF